MLLNILFVLISFIVLYYGARWLVHGASGIALNLNVSKVVVGLTLVAFGTSSPELFVNLIAASRGHTGFALSNIAGSNLANLCIGFGVCSLIGTIVVANEKFRTDLLFFAFTPLIVMLLFLFTPGLRLPFWVFVPFALLFAAYLASVRKRLYEQQKAETGRIKLPSAIGLFLLGCALLYSGGELVLHAAINIAQELHVSEAVIGLTVVAIGTSVPDVMASIIATRHGEVSIAVGNILGSNIFNILLVLGGTALVSFRDLVAARQTVMDYAVVLIVSIAFAVFVKFSPQLKKLSGMILVLFYLAYMLIRVFLL